MKPTVSRRGFFAAAPAAGMALNAASTSGGKPALLGGGKVRTKAFPSWPKFDDREERALIETLRSGKWYRGAGQSVRDFEEAYAKLTGSPEVLATANGTSALIISLKVFGIGPGDEVIVPPYTFIATVNAMLLASRPAGIRRSDPETFQIDAARSRRHHCLDTRAIVPVHLGGNVCRDGRHPRRSPQA